MNIQKMKYKFHSGKKQQTLVLHQGIRSSVYTCLHLDMEGGSIYLTKPSNSLTGSLSNNKMPAQVLASYL